MDWPQRFEPGGRGVQGKKSGSRMAVARASHGHALDKGLETSF